MKEKKEKKERKIFCLPHLLGQNQLFVQTMGGKGSRSVLETILFSTKIALLKLVRGKSDSWGIC